MKVYYSDHFVLPLPAEHRFPMDKYRLLREHVVRSNNGQFELLVPEPASDADILLAHDEEYLDKVVSGRMSAREIRELGFPWSTGLVERSRRSNGATIAACFAAFEDGAGANLAGGTHHAYRARAQGYCVFNDSVVAGRVMQREHKAKRVLIVDCDVHQGNGTAAILRDDPTIFAFSIHGSKNFPVHKEESDLDIELPDGTQDAAYLEALNDGMAEALDRSRPDLLIYVAGADPYEGDRLGRLSLSKEGLATRDDLVYSYCRKHGLPVAVTMGGGYAHNVDDIVDIHYRSVAFAARLVQPEC
ncbi:MAG: histone deacetylase [Acidiferrobacterales bacterium]